MSEAKLIDGLLEGRSEDVGRIRSWIRGSLTSYRARLETELEDLEQEVLIDLISALRAGKFRGSCTLHTFVRTFTHHKCIDRLRIRSRRTMVDLGDLNLRSSTPSAFEHLSKKEDLALALRVFQQMPESCRELWQKLQEGKRYKEISLEMGVSEGLLRARVFRCRQRALELRRQLTQGANRSQQKDA